MDNVEELTDEDLAEEIRTHASKAKALYAELVRRRKEPHAEQQQQV